ncbi:hypothetical protein MHYP_G00032370 [Metynnis hypsauchen]
MRHRSRKALSEKQSVHNISSNHMKAKAESRSTGVSVPSHSSVCRSEKAEERSSPPPKMRRLKTRKERNQIRGQHVSSVHQSCKHGKRGSKEKAHSCNCHSYHASHPLKHFRKEKVVPKPFTPRRPSIITEGRLTSFRGLFSHQVKSVDIERLVKEPKIQEEEQPTRNSPSIPSPSALNCRSEAGVTPSYVQDGQKSTRSRNEVTSEQTQNVEGTVLSLLDPAQTCHQTVDDLVQSGSPSTKRTDRPVVLSSSESELFPAFSTPAKANQNDSNGTPKNQEQTNRCSPAMDMQLDDTPLRSAHFNMEAPPLDPGLETGNASLPALDRERSVDKGQCKKPKAVIENETVGKLAARLCQTLDFPPVRRCCPLLKECREVLLQAMQERHSFRLPKLLSRLNPKLPHSSHMTEQACSSSGQRYGDSTPMHLSFTREDEGGQQRGNMAGNSSRREFAVGDFGEGTERGAVSGKRRRSPWELHSAQDFLTKLQSPCEDTWITRVPSPGLHRAKQHSNSKANSLQQALAEIEIPTPYSFSSGTLASAPFSLQPQKQAKLVSSENRKREVTELFDQWRNDPDLAFLFQENTTELRDWSPHQQKESASERPPCGATTVSAFFPPEGFRYEPFFRFPHSFSSIKKSERSGISHYNHSDIKDLSLSPSFFFSTPYFRYLP